MKSSASWWSGNKKYFIVLFTCQNTDAAKKKLSKLNIFIVSVSKKLKNLLQPLDKIINGTFRNNEDESLVTTSRLLF